MTLDAIGNGCRPVDLELPEECMVDGTGRRPDPESRARTHFANERTCLAWLRTGTSLIALGLASAHFLDQNLTPGFPSTTALAAFLVIGGVAITATGGALFIRARRQIERGDYEAASFGILAAVAIVIATGVLCLAMVLLLHYRG